MGVRLYSKQEVFTIASSKTFIQAIADSYNYDESNSKRCVEKSHGLINSRLKSLIVPEGKV